jgi:hypothetical protein
METVSAVSVGDDHPSGVVGAGHDGSWEAAGRMAAGKASHYGDPVQLVSGGDLLCDQVGDVDVSAVRRGLSVAWVVGEEEVQSVRVAEVELHGRDGVNGERRVEWITPR